MFDVEGMTEGGTPQTNLDPALESYGTAMAGGLNRTYSEDCLALNIWTKAGNSKKAVLVWIYGGGMVYDNCCDFELTTGQHLQPETQPPGSTTVLGWQLSKTSLSPASSMFAEDLVGLI